VTNAPKKRARRAAAGGVQKRARRAVVAAGCVVALLVAWGLRAQQDRAVLAGFSAETSANEQQWEAKFRAIPSPANLRSNMQLLSAHPHHAGSPYDKQNADWVAARFKEWGWDVRVESFRVLFPTPAERVVEMVEPQRFVAKLREPPVPGDPTSNQQDEQLPPYNAYSIDGDITAPLVYVNYGAPEDYQRLESMGISVKGAIVIARYGTVWRGIKPKVAAEHGAVGCLIYSDPRDDGYAAGDVFPRGPWRPPDGVQRGSVMDIPVYPGDPLTPGIAATPDAKRLDIKDVTVFTKIPVLPLSYGDAQPLLEALGGRVAPPEWRGALGITYHIGPGPAKVHLKAAFHWDMITIRDIIATLPGTSEADQWVIRGNHYDAWVNGAQDPISGLSAELEEARALGELRKSGWAPKRTILYCAWDAEEPGLIGSTEWVEAHAGELREHAVAYINSDSNSRGALRAAGTHSLEELVRGVANDVTDPEQNVSVLERAEATRLAAAPPQERERIREEPWTIEDLGSGSDYTAFLDFAGVASLNFAYGGDTSGVYHSAYDDFYWYTHFDDTSFVYGRALAQTAGTAVLRLADADLLPFQFTQVAGVVQTYVNEVERLAASQSSDIRERNREISEGIFKVAGDAPSAPPPQPEAVPPEFDFAPLESAARALDRSAAHYRQALARAEDHQGVALANASLARVNEELLRCEQALTDPAGLPGRPWFKHQLYAPGLYTGYAVKTIPAVREGLEQKQWSLVSQAIPTVARALANEASAVDRAAADLEAAIQ